MGTRLYANNALSTLASAVDAVGTTLTLPAGEGELFPTPSGDDWFVLTLTQAIAETSWEVVKVTARAGNVLTVLRAQEGTPAAAWEASTKAELRVTASGFAEKQDTLVSGASIKTVNGASLLGPGDVAISGGGVGSSGFEQTFLLMGA